MKKPVISTIILFYFVLISSAIFAQDVLDDNIDEEPKTDSTASDVKVPVLVSETIKNISSSQKIFILSNDNQSFASGDFISIIYQNTLVCRALVAKTTNEKLSGVKIVKIYSLELWKQLGIGKDVQIIRGDDSYFSAPKPVVTAKKLSKEINTVKSEDDLYNSTTMAEGDDLSKEESSSRNIKTDNLLAFNIGMIDGVNDAGAAVRYTHLNGTWAYQVSDNTWTEFTLGSNTIRDFPVAQVDTRMVAYSVRLKYTISAPFYCYVQPYLGYQIITAQSPGAQLPIEFALVDQLKKSRVIGGATLLRRIVPGWFARVDFGSDLINGGLLLEF